MEYEKLAAAIELWSIEGVAGTETECRLVLHLSRVYKGKVEQKRVTIGYSELGMWIEKEEPL